MKKTVEHYQVSVGLLRLRALTDKTLANTVA